MSQKHLILLLFLVIYGTNSLESLPTSPYKHVVLNNIDPTPESSSSESDELFNSIPQGTPTGPKNKGPYLPEWDSLDARPLPDWYDDVKIGVFMHWGAFSVPSFRNEWFWNDWKSSNPDASTVAYMKANYPPNFTYQDFARDFTAEFYDPSRWADILEASGAKYVVLTSKHHDGYTMWPSKYSFGWNSDVGPNRDLVGDLATAIRNKTDIKFGLYHSWFEWFNPLYLYDKGNGYNTSLFVDQKTLPELYELVEKYQPEVIWADGAWEASENYWKSKEFLAWLYNESPVKDTVVVNDRWGKGTECIHGGFLNCQDHYNPGHIMTRKWENAMTIDRTSWGFRRNAYLEEYRTPQELILQLVSTVSCGGNFLINVGPTKDGMIAPILEERLLQLGQWLSINGPGIYSTSPWSVQNDTLTPGIWYTTKPKEKKIFAIILEEAWPEPSEEDDKFRIALGSVELEHGIKNITMLGMKKQRSLTWKVDHSHGIVVELPNLRPINQWAWTLVINY